MGMGGQSGVQPPSFLGQNFDRPFLFTRLDSFGHTFFDGKARMASESVLKGMCGIQMGEKCTK